MDVKQKTLIKFAMNYLKANADEDIIQDKLKEITGSDDVKEWENVIDETIQESDNINVNFASKEDLDKAREVALDHCRMNRFIKEVMKGTAVNKTAAITVWASLTDEQKENPEQTAITHKQNYNL